MLIWQVYYSIKSFIYSYRQMRTILAIEGIRDCLGHQTYSNCVINLARSQSCEWQGVKSAYLYP